MAGPVFTGGCQCGAVRYRIDGALGRAGICHCRMCQKAFGSWGAALVSVPVARLTWTRGQPAAFRSSAIVARGFCAQCGTPLHMKEDGDPNYEIAIGSLDSPELAPPSGQVGTEVQALLVQVPRRSARSHHARGSDARRYGEAQELAAP